MSTEHTDTEYREAIEEWAKANSETGNSPSTRRSIDANARTILIYANCRPEIQSYMRTGKHFDYVAQSWRKGQDHAHTTESGILAYCGVDLVTCRGPLSAETM